MKWADIPSAAVLYSGPAAEPLTYDDAKAWLRLPDNTDEALILSLLTDARTKVEQDTGLKLITQSWDVYADAFPDDAIFLPVEPLLSVTSLKVTSSAGVQSTVAATVYQVDTASSPPRITLAENQSWPTDLRTHQGLVIRVSVGYGASGASVPGPLLNAIRQLLTIWYATARAGTGVVPPRWLGYDATIAPYRRPGMA